ncbi:hypothetical protein BSZ35_15165 [Salinibacter sp. 10B]|nr:hypothetical protein BSZ35_15165 [Salinibacter sp. 10B]
MTVPECVRTAARVLRACPGEAYFWMGALVGVASIDPQGPSLLNLCLIENLGLPCPGDGLGQSIAHLVRGQFKASWSAHPLGAPVVAGLVYHIGGLFRSAPVRNDDAFSHQ